MPPRAQASAARQFVLPHFIRRFMRLPLMTHVASRVLLRHRPVHLPLALSMAYASDCAEVPQSLMATLMGMNVGTAPHVLLMVAPTVLVVASRLRGQQLTETPTPPPILRVAEASTVWENMVEGQPKQLLARPEKTLTPQHRFRPRVQGLEFTLTERTDIYVHPLGPFLARHLKISLLQGYVM